MSSCWRVGINDVHVSPPGSDLQADWVQLQAGISRNLGAGDKNGQWRTGPTNVFYDQIGGKVGSFLTT